MFCSRGSQLKSTFSFFVFFFQFSIFKACFLQSPHAYFYEGIIIYCLLFPVILANFGHDNLVLKTVKSILSPLVSNVSRLGPCLLADKDLHFLVLDFLKTKSQIPNIEIKRFVLIQNSSINSNN